MVGMVCPRIMVSAFSLRGCSVLSTMIRRLNGSLPDAEMKLSMSSLPVIRIKEFALNGCKPIFIFELGNKINSCIPASQPW